MSPSVVSQFSMTTTKSTDRASPDARMDFATATHSTRAIAGKWEDIPWTDGAPIGKPDACPMD